MRRRAGWLVLAASLIAGGCGNAPSDLEACVRTVWSGLRPVAEDRARRFLGHVDEARARCRGGAGAAEARRGPWVDWPGYWATGDGGSRTPGPSWGGRFLRADQRGLDGALIDLEYQREQLHLEVMLDIRELLMPTDTEKAASLFEKAQHLRRLTRLVP